MKHICETMKDYIDAMNTSIQGDTIFCTEELWNEMMKLQPERSKREDLCPYHLERWGQEIPLKDGYCPECYMG